MSGRLMHENMKRKRKRDDNEALGGNRIKARKAPKSAASAEHAQARILHLEEQTLTSREHYNNIVKLQELVDEVSSSQEIAFSAAVALCRVVCRLIASEMLVKRKDFTDADAEVVLWLKARVKNYVESISKWLGGPDPEKQSTALLLLMRIVKEEVSQGSKRSEQAWRVQTSTFYIVVKALIEMKDAQIARLEFVDKYVEEYDDLRFYMFLAVKEYFTEEGARREDQVGNALDILARVEDIPETEEQIEDWYGDSPASGSKQLTSLHAHRRAAQDAWLSTFRANPTRDQRKTILRAMNSRILPWFTTRSELLTDFLTDSFDQGGSLSLLALSGIYHLMTAKNLDYPDFYRKLYSLLDDNIMHSKHRSRFFRLLDTFMSSSHLPAAMVASFIKRLSRLSLQAPPGAIVWIVPWTFNLLRKHPPCTFLLHRPYHPAHVIYNTHPNYPDEGMNDPFKMSQHDPMLTGAIDSSLWELETLQSHYHPNVATLAKIMSDQFTKREYQLDDFLDHSYATMIEGELERPLKRAPVVEWEIPKQIVTAPREEGSGLNRLGGMLDKAIATF